MGFGFSLCHFYLRESTARIDFAMVFVTPVLEATWNNGTQSLHHPCHLLDADNNEPEANHCLFVLDNRECFESERKWIIK